MGTRVARPSILWKRRNVRLNKLRLRSPGNQLLVRIEPKQAILRQKIFLPLYEFLCKHDVPAHIHSCACCGRETYDEHFITEESLAITTITRLTPAFCNSAQGRAPAAGPIRTFTGFGATAFTIARTASMSGG